MLYRLLIALALLFSVASAPLTAATAPVTVEFSVRDSWNTGYVADVVITNTGPTDINGWTISFDLPVTFTNFWNVIEGASTATRKVLSNNANTGLLRAGNTRSFGFVAEGDPAVLPTNILFNGLPLPGGSPVLVVSDVEINEGNTTHTLSFPVTLTGPLESTVTVD